MTSYPFLTKSTLCTFCEFASFRSKVEDILCSSLFTGAAKPHLEDIYLDMQKYVDNPRPLKIYPLPFSDLRIKPFFAGHDLPVWLNNPDKADVRIMVVSQDPRRNSIEMSTNQCTELGISSPWGIHSLPWRSHIAKGLLYHVAMNLIKMFADNDKTLSVYFTDAYKFRGIDSVNIDKLNHALYEDILKKEIELVKPDIILAVGNGAQNMVKLIPCGKTSVIHVPHPSAYASIWESHITSPCTADKKGDYYIKNVIDEATTLGIY